MRRRSILIWINLLLLPFAAEARELPEWKPRLFLAASGNVWSPGGVDRDRFLASLGGGISLLYWFDWNAQVMLTGGYSKLNTERYYWMTDTLAALSPDVWDVKADFYAASLELRRLLPTDRSNFLYLGIGVDYVHFGTVEGKYEIYSTTVPLKGTISEERDPSEAFGAHFAPGLFFLFHPRVCVDVTVRMNLLYDGDNTTLWVEPMFTMGYRLF